MELDGIKKAQGVRRRGGSMSFGKEMGSLIRSRRQNISNPERNSSVVANLRVATNIVIDISS